MLSVTAKEALGNLEDLLLGHKGMPAYVMILISWHLVQLQVCWFHASQLFLWSK